MVSILTFSTLAVYVALIASMGLGIVTLGGVGGWNIRLWQLFLIIYLVLQLIRNGISKRVAIKLSVPIFLAIGYFIAIVLSGLNAIDHELWLKRVLLNALFLLLFITVSQGMQPTKSVLVIKTIIFSGVLFSILGILDLFFYNYNRQIFEIIHSFDSSNIDGKAELSSYGMIFRSRGFANEANEFSQYLIIPFGFILAELAFNRRDKLTTSLYVLALSVVFLAQIASLSRGGLLGFLVQVVVIYFIKSKRTTIRKLSKNFIKAAILSILTGAALWFFVQTIFEENIFGIAWERVMSTNTSGDWTTNERLTTIYAGLESGFGSIANLLVGFGAGNLDVSEVSEATTTNSFVDIFSETGVIGITIFLLFVACLIIKSERFFTLNYTLLNNSSKTAFVGAYLSFIGLLIGGLTYSTHTLFYFWLMAGLCTSLSTSKLASAR